MSSRRRGASNAADFALCAIVMLAIVAAALLSSARAYRLADYPQLQARISRRHGERRVPILARSGGNARWPRRPIEEAAVASAARDRLPSIARAPISLRAPPLSIRVSV